MRILFNILLVFISVHFSMAQLTEMTSEQLSKSKVMSITIMGYALDEYGAPSKVGSKKEYSKYNLKGMQTKKVKYDARSGVVSNSTFLFKNGVKYKTLVKDKMDQVLLMKTCDVGRKGEYKSCSGKKAGEEFSYAYSYDKSGNLIGKVKKKESGEVIHSFKYEYDANRNLVKESYQGKKKVVTNWTYNTEGLKVKESVQMNDALSHEVTYAYDKNGDLIQEVKYNSQDQVVQQLRYAYLEKGRISTIKKFNRANQLKKTWKYSYNDKWNLDTIKIYEGAKETPLYMSQYLYKYHKAPVKK